jgi:IS1 family transposase
MESDKKVVDRMKTKYVRVKKMGDKWNTYLQIDHQGFCVVEQTTKKRAEFFGKRLAIALARANRGVTLPLFIFRKQHSGAGRS